MKMNKIKEALSKLIAETFERISTDKGILALDGALEDMEVGMAVSFVDEEGNEVAAEDGDYVLEDGRILRIAEGKIAEIIEPEAEVPAEEAPVEEDQNFAKTRAQFEESYDEKTRKIAEALRKDGYEGWVTEAGDDYAIMTVWAEDMEKHYRFAISWDEEGNPVVGEREEVKKAYVPVEEEVVEEPAVVEVVEEEKPAEEAFEEVENPSNDGEETETEAVVKLREEVNELYELVHRLEDRIAELEKKPAAEPASEEFKKVSESPLKVGKDAHSNFLASINKA